MNKSYIQNIMSKLTPRQKLKYGNQINTLLDDFNIKPIERKPIRIPKSSPFLPQKISLNDFKTDFDTIEKTEKSDDEKEDLQRKIDGMVNGSIIANYVKPSHNGLTATELDKAHLTMASKLYDKGGKNLAQSYLEQKGMSDYKIDDEISDSNGLVVENPQGNAEIAFRGTNITNRDDIRTDMKILAGKGRGSVQFKKALEQGRQAQEKYGNLDHVTGHSLGGAKSKYIGDTLDIPTTSFNPFVSPLGESDDTTITSEQKIIRTNEDMASMGLALRSKGPRTTIKTIRGKNSTLNPIESHRLHNFTEALKDKNDPTFHERLLTDSLNKTKKLGEYHQLKGAIADVDSGLSFTDSLVKFNGGRSNNRETFFENGEHVLNGKIGVKSPLVRSWYDSGGNFDLSEMDALKSETKANYEDKGKKVLQDVHDDFIDDIEDFHIKKPDMGLSQTERKDFSGGSQKQQDMIIEQATDDHKSSLDNLEDSQYLENVSDFNPGLSDHIKTMLHPSNVASGIVSGYLANSAMNLIDSDNKMNKYQRDVVEGGISGATQAGLLAKLSGTALTSSSLLSEAGAGGASYLVKDISEQFIDKGLDKLGASNEASTDVSIIGSDALAGLTYGSISGGLPGAALGFLGGTAVGAGELLEKKANLDLSSVGKDAAIAGAAGLALGPEFVPIAAAGGALFGVGKAIFDKFT
jgi:hypothetical protein